MIETAEIEAKGHQYVSSGTYKPLIENILNNCNASVSSLVFNLRKKPVHCFLTCIIKTFEDRSTTIV